MHSEQQNKTLWIARWKGDLTWTSLGYYKCIIFPADQRKLISRIFDPTWHNPRVDPTCAHFGAENSAKEFTGSAVSSPGRTGALIPAFWPRKYWAYWRTKVLMLPCGQCEGCSTLWWLRLQSWLMPQSPHRLRNDLKCVECDVKPCSIQSNLTLRLPSTTMYGRHSDHGAVWARRQCRRMANGCEQNYLRHVLPCSAIWAEPSIRATRQSSNSEKLELCFPAAANLKKNII